MARIRAWEAAGRPATEGLCIKAYPQDSDGVPAPGQFVVHKGWTQFVFEWRNTPSPDAFARLFSGGLLLLRQGPPLSRRFLV